MFRPRRVRWWYQRDRAWWRRRQSSQCPALPGGGGRLSSCSHGPVRAKHGRRQHLTRTTNVRSEEASAQPVVVDAGRVGVPGVQARRRFPGGEPLDPVLSLSGHGAISALSAEGWAVENERDLAGVETVMQTWDAITSRRNVRSYAERPISAADLDQILEAGRRSPSSQNWQPWDFIVVTDRAQLHELAKVWRGAGHVALLISLGYPADRPLVPISNPRRRPLGEVVHRGRW